jgi:hypothetical protein
MNFTQINSLRKAGQLDQAYELGRQALERHADDLWVHRAQAWVLYDLSKADAAAGNGRQLVQRMAEIGSLRLSAEETIFWEAMLFVWGKYLRSLAGRPEAAGQAARAFFSTLSPLPLARAGKGYSYLLSSFLSLKKNLPAALLADFLRWWDLSLLAADDYLPPAAAGEQRPGMALAERAYIAYAAALEKGCSSAPAAEQAQWREQLQAFLPSLKNLVDAQPAYVYPPYYLGKLLLLQGEREQALQYFRPFALAKQRDFWVWELLSELFPPASEEHLACLCRALLCQSEAMFLVKVRQKLVKVLLQRQAFAQAQAEVKQLRTAYERGGFEVPRAVLQWEEAPWYASAGGGHNNRSFYEQHRSRAEDLLYSGLPVREVAVLSWQPDRRLLHFVDAAGERGHGKYHGREKIATDECYRLWLVAGQAAGAYKILRLAPLAAEEGFPQLRRWFSGRLHELPNGGGLADGVLILPAQRARYALRAGQQVEGLAIRAWDRRKEKAGWRCVAIEVEEGG